MRRRRSALVLALALATVAAACGNGSGSASGSGSQAGCTKVIGGQLLLVARNVKFDVSCASMAAPGKLVITMRSQDQAAHNVHVTGNGVDAKTTLEPGPVTQHLTVDLPAKGTYQFICDLHEFAMKGTIQVG